MILVHLSLSLSLSSNLCTTGTVKAITTVGVYCCLHVKILSDAVRTSRRPLNNLCHLGTKNAQILPLQILPG